jgi:hypothetical protein
MTDTAKVTNESESAASHIRSLESAPVRSEGEKKTTRARWIGVEVVL